MSESITSLTENQQQAIVATLSHPTRDQAADSLGISRVTLWRWSKQPEFNRHLEEARSEVFLDSIARLKQQVSGAVDTLTSILTSGNPYAEIRAKQPR